MTPAILTPPAPAPAFIAPAAPAAPLSSTTGVAVDAGADAVRAALGRADIAGPVIRAIASLSAADRVALPPTAVPALGDALLSLGTIFRVDGAPPLGFVSAAAFGAFSVPGHVKVRWDVTVRPGTDDQSFLAIRTRFEPTDRHARTRLLDAWGVVGPLAESLTRRAAAAIRAAAAE